MKAFDIDIPLALRAVIRAETAEQAEQLARQLADRFAGASDCLDGSAYGTPEATEFSIHDLPATGEGKIDVAEAYDINELEGEQLPTWRVWAARDGETYRGDVEAADEDEAHAKARPLIAAHFQLGEELAIADAEEDLISFDAELDGFTVERA